MRSIPLFLISYCSWSVWTPRSSPFPPSKGSLWINVAWSAVSLLSKLYICKADLLQIKSNKFSWCQLLGKMSTFFSLPLLSTPRKFQEYQITIPHVPCPCPQHGQVIESLSFDLIYYFISTALLFKNKILESNRIRDKANFLNAVYWQNTCIEYIVWDVMSKHFLFILISSKIDSFHFGPLSILILASGLPYYLQINVHKVQKLLGDCRTHN